MGHIHLRTDRLQALAEARSRVECNLHELIVGVNGLLCRIVVRIR